jgi:hypothetical protein
MVMAATYSGESLLLLEAVRNRELDGQWPQASAQAKTPKSKGKRAG